MREDATEAGDVRRMVQALVCDMPGGGGDERMFSAPWELRAFALAVAAFHSGQFQWAEFQQQLIASIQEWESGDRSDAWSYYERWLDALENVLADKGSLTGEALSAEEAHQLGFVNRVVPEAQLTSVVDGIINKIGEFSGPVLEVTKKVISSSQGVPLDQAMKKSQDIYLNQLQALEDVQEGIRAVLEKRKPVWKNK